jgi:glycosyltransferase involved in cell wall biosynthesis
MVILPLVSIRYSVIVPVYNRPQEIRELLASLRTQDYTNFEVVIVEDGSTIRCENIIDEFRDRLKIQYLYKPNSGPGPSRNEGAKLASGDYLVFFDSDCIIPRHYFSAVESGLREMQLDGWGGPDKAHDDFTLLQRAMGYTMSSVLTTGGIRGGKKRIGWFQPRSFNMGLSRKVFDATGGYKFDRFAEDIELSFRMRDSGFKIGLIPEAYVYHKRRTNFGQFYKQVFNFGRGRILVGKSHPGAVKLTHWFPALFSISTVMMLMLLAVDVRLFWVAFTAFAFYLFVLLVHSTLVNKSFSVGLLSVPAALIQFFGYGFGFLRELFRGGK